MDSTTTAILGAILGPIAGMIGTKAKEWLATRDARDRARQLMKEATELLEFADRLQKSASSGGAMAKISAAPLESLHAAVAGKIAEVALAASPQTAAQLRQQRLAQGMLGRLFLSQRPVAWWAWVLHALYYIFLGMTVLFGGVAIYDFRTKNPNREGDMIAVGLFALVTVLLNVAAMATESRTSTSVKEEASTKAAGAA